MSWTSGATVTDVLTALNVSGTTGPFTVYGVGGVLSGTINEAIRGATAYWMALLGDGLRTSTDAWTLEALARFETHYAAHTLLGGLRGQLTTDGFNVSLGGMDIQRAGVLMDTFKEEIRRQQDIATRIIEWLRERAFIFQPTSAEGWTATGSPVTYWRTTEARY